MAHRSPPATSAQFAASVGIHYSMASRLRSGHRRPSFDLIIRIADQYQLDLAAAVRAAHGNAFGAYLDEHVFTNDLPTAA